MLQGSGLCGVEFLMRKALNVSARENDLAHSLLVSGMF